MKLKAYLRSVGMTQLAFSDRIGVTQQTVDLWVRGHRIPRERPMRAIFKLTKKLVDANDFYNLAA